MRAASATGNSTPVSLLAHISETSAVSGVIALSSAARSRPPSASTGSRVTRMPCVSSCASRASVAGCSTALVTMWDRPGRAASAPWIARWLDFGAAGGEHDLGRRSRSGASPPTRAPRSRATSPPRPRRACSTGCPRTRTGIRAAAPRTRAPPPWWRCCRDKRRAASWPKNPIRVLVQHLQQRGQRAELSKQRPLAARVVLAVQAPALQRRSRIPAWRYRSFRRPGRYCASSRGSRSGSRLPPPALRG